MKTYICLFFAMTFSVVAQTPFHATFGSEMLIEGGRVEKFTVVWSNYQFNIRPPKNWSRQLDDATRKLTFTSPSGKSAIQVRFTTNTPGALGSKDELKATALAETPGAHFIVSTICPTSYQPGQLLDLVRVPAPNVVQKLREAFVPTPMGEVELTLSTSEDEFERTRLTLMNMTRAFRVERVHSNP